MDIQKLVREHRKLSNEAGCLIHVMARVFGVPEKEVRQNFEMYKARYLKIANNLKSLDGSGLKQVY